MNTDEYLIKVLWGEGVRPILCRTWSVSCLSNLSDGSGVYCRFLFSLKIGSRFVMHICIHHLYVCVYRCVRVHVYILCACMGGSMSYVKAYIGEKTRKTCHVRLSCSRVHVSMWACMCVCKSASPFGLLHTAFRYRKYLIDFDLRASDDLTLVWWTLNHVNNALSWIECNGIYLWKRWLYSFKVSLGIEAASNQLNKLTPANHQTYQGDVGPMSDYWKRVFKGPRVLTHVASKKEKRKKESKKKKINTSDLSLYCDHIFLLWLCSELSKVSFCWSWTVWNQARPSSAILYITLVLTVFNNVHDCYLLL